MNTRWFQHGPATAQQHGLEDKDFITTNEWHEISWEIKPDSMRIVVDGDIRFETEGDYSGIESAPSVGPCFEQYSLRPRIQHHTLRLKRLTLCAISASPASLAVV